MKRLSPFFKRRFAVLLVVVLCLSTPQLVSWADTEGDAAAGEAADGDIPSEGKGEDSVVEESEAWENSEELKEPGQVEGEDNSIDPEVVTEPWTGIVGEDPDAVEVTGEKTTSTTEDGTEITWSGTGENGNTHAGAEGNETITNPTESFYDKEIEIEDTKAGETDKNVTIGVEIDTIGVDKDGVPRAPEGYALESENGFKATYTKEEGGVTKQWVLEKVSEDHSDPNGKINIYYKTSCGGKTEKWKIEKQKDSQGDVISIKTFKIVTNDQGGIVEEEVVSSSSGTIDVSKSDVASTLEEQQKPKPEDQYGEPEILEDGTLKYTKEDEETGTYYEWTVKEIRDETTGELIGWETVKSNEKTEIVPLDPAEVEQALKPQAPEGYHLSEDGVSYLMTDENGILSTWTVTEIWENDRLVGYTTVETRPEVTITKQETLNNGNKVIITREAVVTREIVEKDPEDASVNVTVGAVTEGTSHGSLRTDSLKPDMNKDPNDGVTNTTNDLFGWTDNNFYQANQSYVVTENSLDIYPNPDASTGQTPVGTKQKGEKLFITQIQVVGDNTWGYIDKEGWVCLGYSAPVPEGEDEFSFDGKYGLSSAVAVNYTNGSGTLYNVHQFIVYDAQGNPHFAYCADLSISPDKVDYGITNVEDSGYFSSEQAAIINAIAVNGYWGTDSGTGSLDAFKDWLVLIGCSKSKAELSWLTDGMAMSITQAAIWYYGSSGNLKVAEEPFQNYLDGQYSNGNNKYSSYGNLNLPSNIKQDKIEAAKHAQSIYKYLTTKSDVIKEKSNNEPATDLINANSISKVEVTVGQNVKELEEATVFNTEGQNDVYNTDVTFYLDVTNSRINNDLIVKVFVAGSDEPLYTYRLEQQSDKDNPSANSRESETYGKILPNGEGGYTLKDLRLENGVEVTLEITGTQVVSKSAYLISAKGGYGHSQTFISVEEGNRSFDLKLSLKLDIEKGQAAIKKEVSSANGTETKWSWSSDSKTTYEYPDDDDDIPEGDDDDDIPEGDDDDDTPEGDDDDDTPEGDDDDDIPEGDDDDDDITVFSEDPGEEIVDEPVPLAEIPVTVELSDAILIAELPEEPVPLAEVPVTVELAEIPDMDVPLAGEPELTDLLDEDVPLSGGPELTDLFDEDVPLADVPETGDISASWYALILSAGCCLMVMRILHAVKKRR